MFKNMLAGKLPVDVDLSTLPYPLLASPKLDGVRASIQGGRVYSRNLKLIPNKHVQAMFGRKVLDGLDGELILGDPTAPDAFRKTSSAVMSVDGEPDVNLHVFDRYDEYAVFTERVSSVDDVRRELDMSRDFRGHGYGVLAKWIHVVPQVYVKNAEQLQKLEQRWLAEGYEGVMLRKLDAPYKQGRSTVKEFYLVKLKRFCDGEAKVLGLIEQTHNGNAKRADGKRSSAKAGLVPTGTLGALYVKDYKTGVEFNIGTGLDSALRAAIWSNPGKYLQKIVKYKYFPTGSKDKPRFPVFLGFRDRRDM
jgi:DNA ligase-1